MGSRLREIGRIRLGPAGGIGFQNGDGKFRARLAVRREQAARIGDRRLRHARGENPGGGLLVLFGHFRDARDGAGAIGGRGVGRIFKIARYLAVFLRSGHRQQVGIARLAARQRFRGVHDAAQRLVVGLVRGRARRAAVEHGAHGNGQRLLGDVLMNRVVGKSRQRVRHHADFDFGLVRVAEFEDFLGDAPQFGVGKQMQSRRRRRRVCESRVKLHFRILLVRLFHPGHTGQSSEVRASVASGFSLRGLSRESCKI